MSDGHLRAVPDPVEEAEPLVDDPLLERLAAIETLPLDERAAAFEALNRQVVGALNELEQL